MSLAHNEKDINVPEIVKLSGLNANSKTKLAYRLYGLKQQDNPAVLFEYRGIDPAQLAPIVQFLNNNKISCSMNSVAEGKNNVYIGIRADIRDKDLDLAAKIVKTAIYQLEGKLSGFNPETKVKVKSFKDKTRKENREAAPKTKNRPQEEVLDFLVAMKDI